MPRTSRGARRVHGGETAQRLIQGDPDEEVKKQWGWVVTRFVRSPLK